MFTSVNPAMQLVNVIGLQCILAGMLVWGEKKKRNNFQWDDCNFEYHILKYEINSSYLKRRMMKHPAPRGILFRYAH